MPVQGCWCPDNRTETFTVRRKLPVPSSINHSRPMLFKPTGSDLAEPRKYDTGPDQHCRVTDPLFIRLPSVVKVTSVEFERIG